MPLLLLLDVDSLCRRLNGRFDRELVDTLRVLTATEVRIVLVSTHAHLLAESLRASLDSAWWYDRVHGWDDGLRTPSSDEDLWSAKVIERLHQRAPNNRVVAVTNDASLRAALRSDDVTIAIAPLDGEHARVDILVSPEQLGKLFWNVIQIRALRQRVSGR